MAIKNRRTSEQREKRIEELLAIGMEHEVERKPQLAEKNYNKALQLDPKSVIVLYRLSNYWLKQHDLTQAKLYIDLALTIDPNAACLHHGLGRIYAATGHSDTATECFTTAIRLDPSLPEPYNDYGAILIEQQQHATALVQLEHFLSLCPDSATGLRNMGRALLAGGQGKQAIKYYQRALALEPGSHQILLELTQLYLRLCNWSKANVLQQQLKQRLEQQLLCRQSCDLSPREALFLFDEPELQRRLEKNYAHLQRMECKHDKRGYEFPASMRLRIGYLVDPQHTPIVLWLGDSLKYHDKKKVEVFMYCYSKRNIPAFRQYSDVYINTSQLSYLDTAKRIRSDKIQILVDLAGYMSLACTQPIFYKPAPIQCQGFAYPGSSGSQVVDYQLLSKSMLSEEIKKTYLEAIVQLPELSFAAAGFTTELPPLSRSDLGLPENKTVLCYLGDSASIDKKTFGYWLKILAQAPHAVLWLMGHDDKLKENLYTHAAQANISQERLVFSPIEDLTTRWPMQLADLWLEPLSCSSATHLMLSYWAGLPYLAHYGETLNSQLAAHYSTACGFDDLVATSPTGYMRIAVALCQSEYGLPDLQKKLRSKRDKLTLFNAKKFMQQLETAYTRMWQIYQTERIAKSFSI